MILKCLVNAIICNIISNDNKKRLKLLFGEVASFQHNTKDILTMNFVYLMVSPLFKGQFIYNMILFFCKVKTYENRFKSILKSNIKKLIERKE